MAGNTCGRVLAVYELGPGYRLEFGISEALAVSREGSLVRLCVTEELLQADIDASALGEAVSSLLLLKPSSTSDREELLGLAARYYARIAGEEVARLKRLLKENIERCLVADIYPAIARLARLQRLFMWLRPNLSVALRTTSYYEWLREIARRAGIRQRLTLAREVAEAVKRKRARVPPLRNIPLSVVSLVDPSLIMEGLTSKPPPILDDPLLLVRLDAARIATKLVSFEEQLYALTSVKKALEKARSIYKSKVSLIRSVERVEIAGFRTAVVKKYRDVTAVKWLVVAIASIPLPRPRLDSLSRLNAEYYYNRLLAELGFNVPNPILVDPRRRMAAYEYVEGKDLSQLLQKTPVPPVYRDLGMLLAELHAKNVSLWDTNPSNFIDTPRGLYVVDLEQARRNPTLEEKAWDIALASYYPALYTPKEAHTRAKLIAEGYLSAGGSREVVEEAAKPKYAIPFLAAVSPNTLERIRRAIASIAENT